MTVIDINIHPVLAGLLGWPFLLVAYNVWLAVAVYFVGFALVAYVSHYLSRDGAEWFLAGCWPMAYYIGLVLAVYAGARAAGSAATRALDQVVPKLLTRTIDSNAMGKLIEQRWSRGRIRRYLIVHDETGEHAIPVPPPTERPPINTVLEAIAWSWSAETDEYKPVIEV